MGINTLGLVAAITAFLCIWIGHVSVRKVEAETVNLWKPTVLFILFGLTSEIFALTTASRLLSTVFGITGITLLWDAFELTRQQKRITKGHAPANPNNPRHAEILAERSSATTLDLLKRDPVGRTVSHEEAAKLVADH